MRHLFSGFALVLFCLTSCDESGRSESASENEIDLKSFYFQLEQFDAPKIYVYQAKGDPYSTQYWKMSVDHSNRTLVTESFNYKHEQYEYFEEVYEDHGVELVEYTMVTGDSSVYSDPIETGVYSWTRDTIEYSVEYFQGEEKIIFSKVRSYVGPSEFDVFGEKQLAIKFKGEYSFFSVPRNDASTFWQYSYYTQKHGFVGYERYFDNGQSVHLDLVEIISEEEWRNRQ